MNLARTFNGANNQLVDLGTDTDACMTRPETCGAAGGAISLWINANDCDGSICGIITSRKSYRTEFVLLMAPILQYDSVIVTLIFYRLMHPDHTLCKIRQTILSIDFFNNIDIYIDQQKKHFSRVRTARLPTIHSLVYQMSVLVEVQMSNVPGLGPRWARRGTVQ